MSGNCIINDVSTPKSKRKIDLSAIVKEEKLPDILNVREKIDDINTIALKSIFLFDFGVDTSLIFLGAGLTLPTVDGVFITFYVYLLQHVTIFWQLK
jgi:hypothetical protein